MGWAEGSRRFVWVLLLGSTASFGQLVSVGVQGGIPISAVEDTGFSVGRYNSRTTFELKRYTVGPAVEVALPLRFRVESGALYKRVRLDRFSGPAPAGYIAEGSRANVWEFPLLLKRRFTSARLAPFVALGSTFRRVGELSVDYLLVPPVPGYLAERQHYTADSDAGLRIGTTAAGGVSRRIGLFRVEPEIRYTHWTSQHYLPTTEQIEFLMSVAFP